MFMLDTDLCIYLINERDVALKDKFEANAGDTCISSITYAELCFGVAHSTRIEVAAQSLQPGSARGLPHAGHCVGPATRLRRALPGTQTA